MRKIEIKSGPKLEDYQAYSSLRGTVDSFLETVPQYVEKLKGQTIWMINSTATGGGVAEMVPSQMRIMRAMGVSIEWMVIETDDVEFFNITKRIHNAIHGSGDGKFSESDRDPYERVNRHNLQQALDVIQDGDVVVIHDPQPMPLAGMLKKHRDVRCVWRCHIGLDESNEVTRAVWSFLQPYFGDYDHFVFSLQEYVLPEISGRTALIPPAIDPLSHKNRMLQMHKCLSILVQAGLIESREPRLYNAYKHQVRRVMPDGSFGQVNDPDDFQLIYRPIITEISRWDRLKGFKQLMEAFVYMKETNARRTDKDALDYKRIHMSRLVLGGPDPLFVTDDPEGAEVLKELIDYYQSLDGEIQKDIALMLLPLDNPKENALIVNALQRYSVIVVQNSIQEGFGLTATEAMWKRTPVLVSGAAGLKFQVNHGETGSINPDPTDIPRLAAAMEYMLSHQKELDKWGFNAQTRVVERFTLFSQIESWLRLLSAV